jgi:26S proteasome regulatory subunit T3
LVNLKEFGIMADVEMSDTKQKLAEQDLYMKMKEMESELEILSIQENYLKDEQRHLKSEFIRSKEEIKRI